MKVSDCDSKTRSEAANIEGNGQPHFDFEEACAEIEELNFDNGSIENQRIMMLNEFAKRTKNK